MNIAEVDELDAFPHNVTLADGRIAIVLEAMTNVRGCGRGAEHCEAFQLQS